MNENFTANDRLTALAAQIVAAYVGNHNVPAEEVPQLMSNFFVGLRNLSDPLTAERPAPFVSPRKSVFPDYIICLEDGKKLKMLKRHLKTAYNLTPDQYRERWSLGADYPMVAPNYAKQRSRLAKQIGLGVSGRRGRKKAA